MATVRRATENDVPFLLAMAPVMHAESPRFRSLDYSEEKVFHLFHWLISSGEGGLLVAEMEGKIVGMLGFVVGEFFFGRDRYASDLFVYVTPESRGGSAFLRLVKAFEAWANEFGVAEKLLGVSTGIHTERTVRAYEGLGYERFSVGLKKA